MSQNRQQGKEGTSFDDRRSRRLSPSPGRMVPEAMNLQGPDDQIMTRLVESWLRPIVREEAESAVRKYMISGERKDIPPYGSRSLQLQFLNAISGPVFTKTPIQGEGCAGCAAMEVALVDAPTRQVVSGGPWSSAEVEIVVLEGDFGRNKGENWTFEEFERNIVRQRDGKKPLLTGDVNLTLKDGKGLVGGVRFTDNSSWTRSRKFRLGARLMDDIDGIRVREARSEPFIVRNQPRDSCRKRYPPSLSDEVWRLKNIRKHGPYHERLRGVQVNTVQDFLVRLHLNPESSERLRNIIDMPSEDWKVTVQHARTCDLDKTLYLYNGSTSQETKVVVFDVVREVIGMFKDDQYVITDKLSEAEKAHAHELVFSAHEHPDQILPLNDEMSLNPPPNSLPSSSTDHQHLSSHNITGSSYSQLQDASSVPPPLLPIGGCFDSDVLCNLDVTGTSYDQSLSFPNQETDALIKQCFNYTDAECLNYSEADGTIDASIPSSDGLDPMDIRCDQPLSFPSQVTDTSIYDTDSISGAFYANENLNYFDTDSTLNPFVPCSVSPLDKAHKSWNILICVLRWKCSIKRIVVAGNTPLWAVY